MQERVFVTSGYKNTLYREEGGQSCFSDLEKLPKRNFHESALKIGYICASPSATLKLLSRQLR